MEFIKLETELPPARTLVVVKRSKGLKYLAFRQDKPLSTNPDPSKDTYWRGQPVDDLGVKDHDGGFATCSFSDTTVESWSYLGV